MWGEQGYLDRTFSDFAWDPDLLLDDEALDARGGGQCSALRDGGPHARRADMDACARCGAPLPPGKP